MKNRCFVIAATILLISGLTACNNNQVSPADKMISEIEAYIAQGDFISALDSISSLRSKYPTSIEARRNALRLWNEASLLQAQHEVEVTDSLLMETIFQIDSCMELTKNLELIPEDKLLEQNMLRNKRDSLMARYDAECGVVRIIREKMKDYE